ncbi:hypothetical protein [Williamsia phyllosphaerae]|uniref:Septation ring formation regulator EzrA n=1 Tax=Williamsia phyllosphaerae TaxID=885042 RepID=A0ABQ1V8D2_9NOCA|nr:hypothetical protein [Williamsia phyllosphaerae]GGF42783.1 hypothetical protein GCM10007298_43100 [Williamsia phyllosphaerae]
MVTGWFGRGPRSGSRTPTGPLDAAREAMVRDFLQLDQRLSIIADGVDAATALGGDRSLAQAFEPVRTRVYVSIDRYLSLSDSPDTPTATPGNRQAEYEQCSRDIHESISALDRFYSEHSTAIEGARTMRAAVPDRAGAAMSASDAAITAVDALPAELSVYTSVRSGLDHLARVRSDFDRARDAADGVATAELNTATAELTAAAEELTAAVEAAPHRSVEVERALSSVRTRLSAVRTRAERLPETYSALLREFSAACSEDLIGHDRRGDEALRAASGHIDSAARLLGADPDQAGAEVGAARSALADAEHFVDGVTDRLTTLRDVRADPQAVEGRVRFQIRDAQLLAVDRGLVPQWGTVLDAAAARADRATAGLTGTHPDYWGYVTELNDIAAFVADVVGKMKGQGRRR